jgi:hypothetical protein
MVYIVVAISKGVQRSIPQWKVKYYY